MILQDGWKAASKSFKAGIHSDLGCPTEEAITAMVPRHGADGSGPGGIVIMMPEAVVFHTVSRKDDAATTAFYPIVVTKSKNKLKFDSHMIFFGLAEVLRPHTVFLTDCGTFYRSDCLTRLMFALVNQRDKLAGVTARQRVMDRNMAKEVNESSLDWDADVRLRIASTPWYKCVCSPRPVPWLGVGLKGVFFSRTGCPRARPCCGRPKTLLGFA